ncbi:MAG: crossover junction endodeoxyribonuclease RuvC [Geminicoccaceae bacterium]|nr:MAG: crossover junction endodeoxyribonuclease RuvC [Geminicoccaceae bacterium]
MGASPVRLIGLDPGLTHTGWGVVDSRGNHLAFVACGRVSTHAGTPLAARLDQLYRGLQAILAAHGPAVAAVEETVVNTNAGSSLKLGQARGVVLLAAAHGGLAVHEYASKTVKRALVGTGGADKTQVSSMVQRLLPSAGAVNADAADALAVALCHAHHAATHERLRRAMGTVP